MKRDTKIIFITIAVFVLIGVFLFMNVAVSVIIFGAFVFSISLYGILFLTHISNYGIQCKGLIKRIEYDGDSDPYPIVEFTTDKEEVIEGKPYIYTSSSFIDLRRRRKRETPTVMILYLAKDPTKFVVGERNDHDYFAFAIFVIAGLAFFIAGICEQFGIIDIF